MLRLVMIGAALIGAADLLLLLPVGLEARYGAGGLTLTVKVGPVPFRILPRKPAKGPARGRARGKKRLWRRVPLPVLRRTAGRLPRALAYLRGSVRLLRLRLHFTAGGDDPCRAAMAYARACLALEGIGRLCGPGGRADLRAEADFGGATVFDGEASVRVCLGHVLAAALCMGLAILREYYRYQKTEG